jgi:hypothetical protein
MPVAKMIAMGPAPIPDPPAQTLMVGCACHFSLTTWPDAAIFLRIMEDWGFTGHMKRRAAIIGGSMSGLFAAAFLRQ